MHAAVLALVVSIPAVLVSQSALTFEKTEYTVRAGQPVELAVAPESRDFLKNAVERRVSLRGKEASPRITVAPNADGTAILLAASLSATPGDYSVDVTASSPGSDTRTAAITVHVLARESPTMVAGAAAATPPPVILINGWTPGSTSCGLDASFLGGTFGTLGSKLNASGIPTVYYFDTCAECPNCTIENLGIMLNDLINGTATTPGIEYTNGMLVPQIDIIAFDMGGLVARAYLSGFQPNGAFATPVNSRIRKLIEIAVPNFGTFLATNSSQSPQTLELAPGSPLIWNLARWNQGSDDLRGVDALAIIGNAGALNGASGGTTGYSDGVVSTTSASIGFATGIAANRTRILPYCHTTNNPLVSCASGAAPIAFVDLAPQTLTIIDSFLTGTTTWQSTGTAPAADTFLATLGGVLFALETASNVIVSDVTSVSLGSVAMQAGVPAGEFYYTDFVKGSGALILKSSSLGSLNCMNYLPVAGRYSSVRCKESPYITGVSPEESGSAAVVAAGATITISGSGFGSRCNGCAVTAFFQATTPGIALATPSWTNTAITATIPSAFQGFFELVVTAATGTDSINIVVQSATTPVLNAAGVVNGADYTATLAPGSIASAFGTSLATSTASATAVPLPNTLASAQLLVNGSVAPLFYVSPAQMNFQVPFGVSGSTTFQVSAAGLSTSTITANVAATAPGIFSVDSSGTGQGTVLNQDFSANSASNPATVGSVIQIYCTGLGDVMPTLAAGAAGATSAPFNATVAMPSVTINGVNAPVQFSAIAPGFVGLYQVNAQVPPGVSGSTLSLQISVSGTVSNTVTVAVK